MATDNAIAANDGTVSDVDAGQDDSVLPNPHVISNNGVAFQRHFLLWRRGLLPAVEDVERKGRRSVHLMVRAVHDEFHACRDLAELDND